MGARGRRVFGGWRGRWLATAALSVGLLALGNAAPAVALTRVQADRAALGILRPAKVRTHIGTVVYGLPRPLPAGTAVFEAGEPRVRSATSLNIGKHRRRPREAVAYRKVAPLARRAWLYWMDPAWGTRFSHTTVMLLIDDRTGRPLVDRSLSFWPLIDGEDAPFVGAGPYDDQYQIFSNVRGGSTGVAPPVTGAPPAPSAKARAADSSFAFRPRAASLRAAPIAAGPGSLAGECVISIGLRDDPQFARDFAGLNDLTKALTAAGTGLQAYGSAAHGGDIHDTPDGYDLYQDVGVMVRSLGCQDIMIYIDGHGTAPGKGPARVLVGKKWTQVGTDANGKERYQSRPSYVSASDLKAILRKYSNTTFKVKVDASFSGRFIEAIPKKKFRTVHVFETSSSSTEYSYSYISAVKKNDGSVVPSTTDNPGNVRVDDPGHPGEKIHAPGRGEFTNGNLAALWQFFTSEQLVSDAQRAGGTLLAQALTYAAKHSDQQDFAAQHGLTHPKFYSDQPVVLPPVPPGATMTLGSTLTPPADTPRSSPQDEDFWPLTYAYCQDHPDDPLCQAGPAQATMPAEGQIVAIRLKGVAVPSGQPGDPGPLTEIHFSDLRPQADGSVRVIVTSQAFNIPASGDPNQVNTFAPENFCVQVGDILTLSTEGGFDPTFYPDGVPFRVFAHVPRSQTAFFTMHNGVMNGAQFSGAPLADTELLMQWDLATGSHATRLCPGGTAGR